MPGSSWETWHGGAGPATLLLQPAPPRLLGFWGPRRALVACRKGGVGGLNKPEVDVISVSGY